MHYNGHMKKTTSLVKAEDTLTAAAFKAHCLRVMDEVARRRRPLTITKRGKPIVRLVPLDPAPNAFVGIAAGLKTELELLQAQQQLEGSRRDLNRARYDMITSLVKLKAAAGQLGEDDVQFLDRMFTGREASPDELLASN